MIFDGYSGFFVCFVFKVRNCLKSFLKVYLFILAASGCQLPHAGSMLLHRASLVVASRLGSCGVWVSCPVVCGILVPQPGI